MTGLSWADTSGTVLVGWQSEPFAFDSVGARLAANPSTAAALRRAAESGSPRTTTPLRSGWFGPQVLIIAPVKQGDHTAGYLISGLELDAYVESVLDAEVAQGYGYALRDGATLLHERKGTRSPTTARWHVTVPVSAMGRLWMLTVWPTDEIIAANASIVPTAVLVAGLCLAALIGWIAFVALRSRELTSQLSALVGELAAENGARRESEQMRAALVHSTIDGVAAFDASGCVSAWNPRMAALTGRAEREVDGRMIGELIPFLEAGTEVQMLLDALAGRATLLPDVQATEAASGAGVWLEVSVTPMRSPEGDTVGGLLVARDVTERKRVADLVLAGKLAAEEANRAKSDFLARMSHELRTPLNAVIGFTNVLGRNKHGRLSPDELTYVDRIGANGRHLLGLINEVLDLAKVESGRDTVQLATTSLSALVADTIAELDVRASGASVRLLAQLPSGPLEVRTDEAKLKQVLINLIGNAIKFTPAAGRVTVRLFTDATTGRPSRIDVEDTGIGIPPEHIGAIFEAFEQVDTDTSRRFGGTGLGLAISRKLCELMDYDLVVRSEVGAGSTFSVVLSSAREDQEAA
jgi:PAS domain S-box-containing protein